MRRKKRNLSVLLVILTLMIMLLPVSEAGAKTSASDFRMEGSTLVKYRGSEKNVTIPGTVEVIGKSAFEENKDVELIVLSNSVKRIEAYAFWGCDNLDTVVLGRGLSEVGDYAFTKCTGLEQITIPANVTAIGIQAFGDCTNLRDITIPKETTSIHETAFDGCSQITFHCEPGSAAEEYAEAFYERRQNRPDYDGVQDGGAGENTDGTQGGADAEEPSGADRNPDSQNPTQPVYPAETGSLLGSTQIVGNRAVVMADNTQLRVYGSENGQRPEGNVSLDPFAVDWSGSLPKYRIVDGRVVADRAWYQDKELDVLTLPDGIEEIGELSFARSTLETAVLPEGVKHIGYAAFYHCDDLREVRLPDTVMCVEPKAFSLTAWVNAFLSGETGDAGNDFLTEGGVLVAYRGDASDVRIPDGVRVIAGEAFLNHDEIERLVLPDSLLVVGEGAFAGCSGLKEIVFGSNVEEIKDRAFLGNAMDTVSLPSSVKKVGLQAFGDAAVSYEGAEAEAAYEPSAAKLANAAYRVYPSDAGQMSGVTVEGLEEAFGIAVGESFRTGETFLTDVDRAYTLKVTAMEDTAVMDAAFERVTQAACPEDLLAYELELTDASGVRLKNLGQQALHVVLPLPQSLAGQEVRLFTLDSNGQLESLPAEIVTVDGVEAFCFETDYVSMIGVWGGNP